VPPTRPLRPAKGHGPIFIIGAMGSGTTLLRLILDSHEHIAIPYETGFMRTYKALQFVPFKWTGRAWYKRLGWSTEEFDAEARAFFDRIFMRYASEHGKQRWGDKTPLHTWHVPAIARLFPDAVFVAIVRHPGASTASNMRRFHHTAWKMALHWDRYNREIARLAATYPRRVVVVRYEELLLQTEPVMRELLDWLGEPWSRHVLEHHVVQSERGHALVEGKSRPDESIDATRVAKWAGTIDAEDRAVIGERADRLGDFYGYSMDHPEQLAPLNERGSLLFGGGDVAQRIERFADLELHKRGVLPIFEQHLSPRKLWLVENPTGEPVRHQRPATLIGRAVAPVVRRLPRRTRIRLRATSDRIRGHRSAQAAVEPPADVEAT
jgi:Sulfotransferase family